MIILLKISTFNPTTYKELLMLLQKKKFFNKLNFINSTFLPKKKIKRTILRSPHGDKKTGQDSLELTSYKFLLRISINKWETFLNFFMLNLINLQEIKINLITSL